MCGILFIVHPRGCSGEDLFTLASYGLEALQHRGQDGCGIAYGDGSRIWVEKRFGLVANLLGDEKVIDEGRRRRPRKLFGHLRYSTAGGADSLYNYQPHYLDTSCGRIAFGGNGDLPDLPQQRASLEADGVIFYTENDAEFIVKKIDYLTRKRGYSLQEAIVGFMETTRGTYSAVLMAPDETYVFRDPHENRPLWFGRLGTSIVVASETSAFDILGATVEREVSGGEILRIRDDGGIKSSVQPLPGPCHRCIFERTYFARPDSKVFGDREVGSFRYHVGKRLWQEHPVEADIVAPIPQSGNLAAVGFAVASGIPLREILIRNPYIHRTFIMPDQPKRQDQARRKFGLMKRIFEKARENGRGLRVVLTDDSIVRGTTTSETMKMVREAGAAEIHLRIGFPPVTHPCFYGIAMPTKEELIASTHSVEEIRRFIGVDTLGYLSPGGLRWCVEYSEDCFEDYCSACYTGQYAI